MTHQQAANKNFPILSHKWKDFNEEQLLDILACKNNSSMKERICEILQMNNNTLYTLEQSNILLDFYLNNIMYCKRNGLENEKIATYFSIMKDIHERSMDPNVSLVHSFSMFKELLVKHSVHRPPFSMEVFSLEEVKKLSYYTYHTYYRHFKLYQYSFCKKQVATLKTKYMDDRTEKPFSVKPLSESIRQEDQEQHK